VKRAAAVAAIGAVLVLGAGASEARPAGTGGQVTITMLTNVAYQPAFQVLIPNFERVYPNITVNITYAATSAILNQLETTELAAGDAPDLLAANPGCGAQTGICQLARAGYLVPMIKAPWAKRSLPVVTSADKYGQGLFAFTPTVGLFGIFTNPDLFGKLGLKLPQTFSQLLAVCQKARAAGVAAVLLPGAAQVTVEQLIDTLAVATVYAKDTHWTGELKAGTVSFDGSPGWQQALQELIEMNSAGCFQPGATGTTLASAEAEFAQGQGLMLPTLSTAKAAIDSANPEFPYAFAPFPSDAEMSQTGTFFQLSLSTGVNAHSSTSNQAAAQTFINFIARPKQNALYAQTVGGLTQYEFLMGQVPEFMSDFAPVVTKREYVINPSETWWNANVAAALQTDGIGLVTGQETIDDVLNAMDAAWKQGPS
jgi:raffinose/stachyose/melibiose transport system substrate-binding protein